MDKTIIITGAGSGIGAAAVDQFLEAGYKVGLVGRNIQTLEKTARGHENALVMTCDVSVPEHVETVFAKAVHRWGRVDVLFNNAGRASPSATPDEIDVKEWLDMVNVNLNGTFLCARAAFAQMRAQSPRGGRIINNGSVSSHVPRPGSAAYTASKHGVTGLTRSISLDGRQFNIVCSQIDVGNALTKMTERMKKGVKQADGNMRREPTIDVKHVAKAVLQMAELPLDSNIQFMTIMASMMPYIGRG